MPHGLIPPNQCKIDDSDWPLKAIPFHTTSYTFKPLNLKRFLEKSALSDKQVFGKLDL